MSVPTHRCRRGYRRRFGWFSITELQTVVVVVVVVGRRRRRQTT